MIPSITLFVHQLPQTDQDIRTLEKGVAPDELARARRFHFDRDRHRWLAGRVWIRHRLGSVLNRPFDAIAFSAGNNGKPGVTDAPAGFGCNWSHSGDWVALAMSEASPVGVDIECVRDDFPDLEVAEHVLTRAETAALERTDEPARHRLFLRLWTAKEALMKATGAGLSMPPNQIEVSLAGSVPTGYTSHPDWHLAHREGLGWQAAVAWPAHTESTVQLLQA